MVFQWTQSENKVITNSYVPPVGTDDGQPGDLFTSAERIFSSNTLTASVYDTFNQQHYIRVNDDAPCDGEPWDLAPTTVDSCYLFEDAFKVLGNASAFRQRKAADPTHAA